MDLTTLLLLAASAAVGAAGLWLSTMAMQGAAPARARAEHDDDA